MDGSQDNMSTARQQLFSRIDAARAQYARALDVLPVDDAVRREDARRAAEAALRLALAELEPLRPAEV